MANFTFEGSFGFIALNEQENSITFNPGLLQEEKNTDKIENIATHNFILNS